MNLIILLIVGGLIGWVASMIMKTDAQQGIILSVIVGIVGAMLAGFLITPLIGGTSIMEGGINIQSILVSLLGAFNVSALVIETAWALIAIGGLVRWWVKGRHELPVNKDL